MDVLNQPVHVVQNSVVSFALRLALNKAKLGHFWLVTWEWVVLGNL